MRPRKPPDGHLRRRYRPGLEGLEDRDLLSTAAGSANSLNSVVNSPLIAQLVQQLYGPITTTDPIQIGNRIFPPGTYAVPQPTPSEIRRQVFITKFVGRYTVGPPRFSNQASTINIFSSGKNVSSNQFDKGRAQIVIFPPADPHAQPNRNDPMAGQIAGLMMVVPSNTLQSSSVLFLNLTNQQGVASNDPSALDHGYPSKLSFKIDGPVSAGAYTAPSFATTPSVATNAATGQPISVIEQGGAGGAVAFFQGAGIVTIHYIPNQNPLNGAAQSGTAIVTVEGLINNSGTLNALYKGIN
jgi:hypothetical protein